MTQRPARRRSTKRSRSPRTRPSLHGDLQLIPWLALGPLFLRETGAGRPLLENALRTARACAAVGALPFVLNLIARDQAATDRWAAAAATYQEAIDLARESGQRTELTFGLAGCAWLQARRGREQECRACATEALGLVMSSAPGSTRSGLRRRSANSNSASATRPAPPSTSSTSSSCCATLAITDADLSPAAELTDAYTRLGLTDQAQRAAAEFMAAATRQGTAMVARPRAALPGTARRGQRLLAATSSRRCALSASRS